MGGWLGEGWKVGELESTANNVRLRLEKLFEKAGYVLIETQVIIKVVSKVLY